jgi:hypothetical protein
MLDSITIQSFARALLELAASHECAWATLELADDQLVTTLRVLEPGRFPAVVDENQVPIIARVASSHVRARGTLKLAVLDQDPALLTPLDAHDVIEYALHRAIRRVA